MLDPVAVQDAAFLAARSFREAGDEVAPVAFVVTGSDMIVIVRLSDRPKSEWRPLLEYAVKETRARALVIQVEARMGRGPAALAGIAALAAGADSMEGVVGVTDVVYSTLEVRGGAKSRTLFADVLPDGTLGPTEVSVPPRAEGNLVGFFPTRD